MFIGSGIESLGRGWVVGDEEGILLTAVHQKLLMLTLKVSSPLKARTQHVAA